MDAKLEQKTILHLQLTEEEANLMENALYKAAGLVRNFTPSERDKLENLRKQLYISLIGC